MTAAITSTVVFSHVYEYDAGNRLTKVDDQAYTWDNNGNLRNNGVFTFTYDAANRLITVTNGTTLTLGYRYNGDGVLVAQTVDGVETTFVQDVGGPLPQILVETSGGSTKRHLYGVVGTNLMKAAARESIARGYSGRIVLHAADQAIGFYEKMGGVLVDPASNLFSWDEAAVQALLRR